MPRLEVMHLNEKILNVLELIKSEVPKELDSTRETNEIYKDVIESNTTDREIYIRLLNVLMTGLLYGNWPWHLKKG